MRLIIAQCDGNSGEWPLGPLERLEDVTCGLCPKIEVKLTIIGPHPLLFSYVWQRKDLREGFLYVWQRKELALRKVSSG